jgi:hypothetical protein
MRNFKRTDVREEASANTGRKKWDKEQRPETTATKQEGIQQDLGETLGLELVKQIARSSVRL